MATVYFSLSAKLIGGKKQVMVRFGGTGFNQRAKSGLYVNPTYWDDLTQGVTIPKPRLLTEELIATIKELREADAKLRELRLFIEDEYIKDTSAPAKNANWLKEVVYVGKFADFGSCEAVWADPLKFWEIDPKNVLADGVNFRLN